MFAMKTEREYNRGKLWGGRKFARQLVLGAVRKLSKCMPFEELFLSFG